jgi:hypothetical protein
MKCSEIRELLSGYVDGVLEQHEAEAVKNHLSECQECSRELADLQQTISLLNQMGEIIPPVEFRDNLRKRLKQEPVLAVKNTKSGGKGRFRLWLARSKRPLAAAVMVLALGVSIGLYGLTQMNSSMTENTAVKNDQPETATQLYSIGGSADESARSSSGGAEPKMKYTDQAPAANSPVPPASNPVPSARQKIIKDGNMVLEVNSFKDFGAKLQTQIEYYGGFIENSSENSAEKNLTANYVIRVPVDSFSGLVKAIEVLGKVTSKQLSGSDVTGEYIDTESRLRNFQRQEQRLLTLVDKAESLADVLTLENELSRIRGEIEVLQSRIKSLSNLASYSTIRLEVKEVAKPKVEPAKGIISKFFDNLKESWIALLNFLGGVLELTGALLPWAAAAGAVAGTIFYIRKKIRGKDESKE